MPSLVSDFILNPVLRQARRFSSGFAAEEPPRPSSGFVAEEPLRPQRRRPGSAGTSGSVNDAILESDEDGEAWIVNAGHTPDGTIAHRNEPSNSASPSQGTLLPSPEIVHASSGADTERSQRPHTSDSSQGTNTNTQTVWSLMDNAKRAPLPEDDGMGELRRKIQAISAMDVSQESKAQMVHQLLIENYNKSQQPSGAVLAAMRPESPSGRSAPSQSESPGPTGPLQALKFWNPLGEGSGPLDLPLTAKDLQPTYAPNRAPTDELAWGQEPKHEEAEANGPRALGCQHYRRNVKLQCAACEKWYTCRFCHDEAEDHPLPRQQTKHMLCMLCGCAQKASDSCSQCGQSAAYYYCGICKLWNDDPNKPIYHCPDCGLCRVGQGLGKDFFHCKKCMACISTSGQHKCIERSTDCDCPICGDYLFNSPKPVVFMQCGHSIHRHCFDEHKKTSYRCPLCSKSCVNMEYHFRNVDAAVAGQPMPPEYRDARAIISCNDCSAKSQTAYHWLGLKCSVCGSYNTSQLQLLHMPGGDDGSGGGGEGGEEQGHGGGEQELQREMSSSMLAWGDELRQRDRSQSALQLDILSQSLHLSSSPGFLSRFLSAALGEGEQHQQQQEQRQREEEAGASSSSTTAPAVSLPPPTSAPARSAPTAVTPGTARTAAEDDDCAIATEATETVRRAHARAGWDGHDSDEDDDDSDDMLDLFWGRDRSLDRAGGNGIVTSTDDTVGADEEGEEEDEEEEESSEDEDEDCDEDEDEDEDEEDEIVLVGHR